MALTVIEGKRKFEYEKDGDTIILPDIESMSVDEICEHYAGQYPELINGSVSDIENKGEETVYTISSKAMTKG